ncbi:MAG: MoaD/ThiS family protein [Gemmatimonadota bacterium]|nr:MoaD/ThiS family protein [Gemmatimonadota bacterium]
MTRWTVRLFGPAREAIGTDRTEVDVGEPATAAAVVEAVAARHPEIADLLPRSRVAVEREYVDPEARLRPGDEIAILPPVGGG